MKRAILNTISARLKIIDAERVQITLMDTDTGETVQLVWNWRISNPKSAARSKQVTVNGSETIVSDINDEEDN